ncbi:lycopene cyclase domain-containing protein [Agrococcus beijingensis]|uniref:lycopene cyclase domain-containing protein n=1 Tax=Agrococcus beijingensis TaxID=3068634 RepID=UPI002740C1C9|nr:lycopene cyclase domain-containing protein [Agrococcus sp. REN33]
MTLVYLGVLLLSAIGTGLLDLRWRLALFRDAPRTAIAVLGTAAVLLLIDLAGIATGNFKLGASPWMTGFELLPHLPIEELVFITFLAYVSLVAYAGAERLLAWRRARTAERSA